MSSHYLSCKLLCFLPFCFLILMACILMSCKTAEDDITEPVMPSLIVDTVYVDSVLHDTIIVDKIITDTTFVDSIIHDTTYVDTLIHDTVVVGRELYHNPVIGINAPDPTVIRASDGYFYLYATSRNVSVFKSPNLTNWIYVGNAFDETTRPAIVSSASIWAPDINYIDGKYVMYYSQSVWGGSWTCGIGIAVSDTPQGPFTDLGALFTSKSINVKNSIDPFYIETEGKKYLFWGSLCGIYGIRLADDGMSVMPGSEKFQVASNGVEGTYIHYHDGKYFLFVSKGLCCEGANSTYHVVYGRSDSIEGPYYTKEGRPLLYGNYNKLLQGNGLVAGPGHNSEFITDDAGNDWLMYHGYLKSDPEAGRLGFLDQINWVNGWPEIKKKEPSEYNYSPVIIK